MGRGTEMKGCQRCIQVLLFSANFIIWVGSIALLVLGIWAAVDRSYLEEVVSNDIYLSSAYILISVGAIAFFLSFLGCFGALREVKSMLLLYFILLLILFIILLVGGIIAAVFYNQAEIKIKEGMMKSIKNYEKDSNSPLNNAWDDAQKSMKCCGVNTYKDWEKNEDFGTDEVPQSCCKGDADCTTSPAENAYTLGCFGKIQLFLEDHAKYIGGAGITVALLMILGLVLSISLYFMIED